jgi:hypothetical protein
MVDNGTLQTKVDKTYNVLLAMLDALPIDIDPEIAKRVEALREALLLYGGLKTGKKPELKTDPARITFNADQNPVIPHGMHLNGEKAMHQKMGEVATLEKRADKKLYLNDCEVIRYSLPNQRDKDDIRIQDLYNELNGRKELLNACVLDTLLEYRELLPDEWKEGETYFFGTLFCNEVKSCVKCLSWCGYKWVVTCCSLSDWWNTYKFIAVIAETVA